MLSHVYYIVIITIISISKTYGQVEVGYSKEDSIYTDIELEIERALIYYVDDLEMCFDIEEVISMIDLKVLELKTSDSYMSVSKAHNNNILIRYSLMKEYFESLDVDIILNEMYWEEIVNVGWFGSFESFRNDLLYILCDLFKKGRVEVWKNGNACQKYFFGKITETIKYPEISAHDDNFESTSIYHAYYVVNPFYQLAICGDIKTFD